MVSKSQTLGAASKQQLYFSDFLNNLNMTPIGNDLAKVNNERAVTQSIKNLIYTSYGERLFQPNIGCGIYTLLFEMSGPDTDSLIKSHIELTINNYEPRCQLVNVNVVSSDEYITITIVYFMANVPDPISAQFIIKRIR